jgi:hypothetical protein
MNRTARAGTIAALLIAAGIHAQTRKTPAPIIDGPAYTASQDPNAPAEPSCAEALQVIGHDAEAVHDEFLPVEGMESLHHDADMASIAQTLLDATQIAGKNNGVKCQKIVDDLPRIYPAYLDKQDHMSTERIVSDLGAMRFYAGERALLEALANRDISH